MSDIKSIFTCQKTTRIKHIIVPHSGQLALSPSLAHIQGNTY